MIIFLSLLSSRACAEDYFYSGNSSSPDSSRSGNQGSDVAPSGNNTIISQSPFTPNNNPQAINPFNNFTPSQLNFTPSQSGGGNSPGSSNPYSYNSSSQSAEVSGALKSLNSTGAMSSFNYSQPGLNFYGSSGYNNPVTVSLSVSQPGGGYNAPNSYNNTTVITSLNQQPGGSYNTYGNYNSPVVVSGSGYNTPSQYGSGTSSYQGAVLSSGLSASSVSVPDYNGVNYMPTNSSGTFITAEPGYFQANPNGTYSQIPDPSDLGNGTNDMVARTPVPGQVYGQGIRNTDGTFTMAEPGYFRANPNGTYSQIPDPSDLGNGTNDMVARTPVPGQVYGQGIRNTDGTFTMMEPGYFRANPNGTYSQIPDPSDLGNGTNDLVARTPVPGQAYGYGINNNIVVNQSAPKDSNYSSLDENYAQSDIQRPQTMYNDISGAIYNSQTVKEAEKFGLTVVKTGGGVKIYPYNAENNAVAAAFDEGYEAVGVNGDGVVIINDPKDVNCTFVPGGNPSLIGPNGLYRMYRSNEELRGDIDAHDSRVAAAANNSAPANQNYQSSIVIPKVEDPKIKVE